MESLHLTYDSLRLDSYDSDPFLHAGFKMKHKMNTVNARNPAPVGGW